MTWLADILDLLSWLALMAGGFCVFSGGLGLLRFPDFFSRMHAAGVMDTLGAGLILLGLLFQVEDWLVAVKLLLILAFIGLTSPTASHALAKSAIHGGLRPLLGEQLKADGGKD
ncbi:MAG: monovalent cation/H(+) antiporter subunit G [Gammaproteobacteria bacterium SHHR-1]|uniref:monovalent cation/H(+) antiporter subunit G n=1 Tax=Magnetovirga frankeli TaxID=947516 RepID=UPI001293A2AB|nr:monovalent cation/H(+) antiporter subunit G [gamma proteobacterium SS-5]